MARLLACSYDYEHALSEILPSVAAKKIAKGGFMVLRPDSGDPVQTVVLGLRAAEKVFGCYINGKGFKVPRGCSVIQGVEACKLSLSWSSFTNSAQRRGRDQFRDA